MACAGTSLAPSSTKVAIDWDAVKVRTSTAATIEVSRVALSIPLSSLSEEAILGAFEVHAAQTRHVYFLCKCT